MRNISPCALQDPVTTEERLKTLVRRVTSRTPLVADLQTPQAGLANLLVRYQAAPDDAVLLLKEGAREVPADLNPPELAARMLVASTVLNFDQTLVRD